MEYNQDVAKQTYENFKDWSSKKASNADYVAKNYDETGKSKIYDTTNNSIFDSEEKQKRNESIAVDLETRKSEEELGDFFDLTKTLEDISKKSDEKTKKGIKEGLKTDKFFEYYNLGIGEVLTKDKNNDGKLDFNEFSTAEKAECPDIEYTELMDKELKAVFDSIASYNNEIESDNDPDGSYISMSEMTNYYYAEDKMDNENKEADKKLTSANVFNDFTKEIPTVVIDEWSGDEENNIDCPSRLIKNIYKKDFDSKEGQEIWNKVKELNPGIDENNYFAGYELKLPY